MLTTVGARGLKRRNALSPSGRPRLGRAATWFGKRKQRLVYVLAAGSLAAAVGAATVGGFLLRHAANVERQALRTQALAGAVAQLRGFSLRAEADGGTNGLAASRKRALEATFAAFRDVRAHDRAESNRIRSALLAYVEGSTREFNRATASGETLAQQRRIDRELSRFESQINIEMQRLAHATRVTNPKARLALIIAAVAASLLVGSLIWQFELQRRAGRIDRDNAARSEELSRLREEFVAAVSHELRTPLTSIIGYLDLIKDDQTTNLTPEQQAFLAVVERNANRLHELVGDLLLVAETDGGGLALDLQDVDLDALAADCVESARPTADARQITLTLSRGAPPRIQGDPFRLEQMMDNLVSNAIKFTPEGGSVSVRTALDHGFALFEVADTGPGISPADQEKLFDRFFRSPTAIEQAIRGTGLGLAITKAIVDAHQGLITIESAVGKHSTFRVQLPETQEPASAAPA
jgi:signal transduction histidine kinase